jgi:hypothetical protein
MKRHLTYDDWMAAVDAYMWRLLGCSIHELPDVPLRDWWTDGASPLAAARRARHAAFEG